MLPTTRTHFGYRDGIGIPLIEGSGFVGYPGQGPAIKAGEFILGYPDETGNLPAMPQPEILGRNGTYLGFRKLYSHVASFRQYLRANAESQEDEELLKAIQYKIDQMKNDYTELKKKLGGRGASEKTARLIYDAIKKN